MNDEFQKGVVRKMSDETTKTDRPTGFPIRRLEATDVGGVVPVPWDGGTIQEGVELFTRIQDLAHREDRLREEIRNLDSQDDSILATLRKGAGFGMFERSDAEDLRARRKTLQAEMAELREEADELNAEREDLVREFRSRFVPMRTASWAHLRLPEPRRRG